MRVESLMALVLILSFCSSAHGQHAPSTASMPRSEQLADLHKRSGSVDKGAFAIDITQKPCALYVALRSGAFESPVAFGRDLDDMPVHWNKCPGGTMVACVVAPAANGDTVVTGIPWPY